MKYILIYGFLLIGLTTSAQFLQPPAYKVGCPTSSLQEYIRQTTIEPGQPGHGTLNPIDPNYLYKECFNCAAEKPEEIVACQLNQSGDPNFKCPQCIDIVQLESVFNPKSGKYETVYTVTTHELDGGIKVWYTYQVFFVPIFAIGPDGVRKIIGYRYEWLIIPGLTAIETNVGGSKMIFN